MSSIKDYETSELINELNHRQEEREKSEIPKIINAPDLTKITKLCEEYIAQIISEIPKIINAPDLTKLIKLCEEYIAQITEDGEDSDYEHYIYEEVMTTFYGDKVFDFINKVIK